MPLHTFLQRSAATEAFREAVADFQRTQRANERIDFDGASPPVKVERTLTQLLETYPALAIERVAIRGQSGCEYYRGELSVYTADTELRIHFHWDCRWKAEQQGWTDAFGFADQIRAAREFGYACFRKWSETPQRAAV